MAVPVRKELRNATLQAIRDLGGSASISEIVDKVIEDLTLPEESVNQMHGDGPMTELEYRLGWTRTSLKRRGLVANSSRGIWSLTKEGEKVVDGDPNEDDSSPVSESRDLIRDDGEAIVDEGNWKERLLKTMLDMDPAAFERLCQRVLRESGFIEVTVTGRSGDGGIDGRGVIRLSGLVGFPVLFQCKRYSGVSSVTASQVRDFRGAMTGRADRGLIITTGRFTESAKKEAARDGAPPIDLIGGELLVEKLKELGLGVTTRQVEVVEVDADWFANL